MFVLVLQFQFTTRKTCKLFKKYYIVHFINQSYSIMLVIFCLSGHYIVFVQNKNLFIYWKIKSKCYFSNTSDSLVNLYIDNLIFPNEIFDIVLDITLIHTPFVNFSSSSHSFLYYEKKISQWVCIKICHCCAGQQQERQQF